MPIEWRGGGGVEGRGREERKVGGEEGGTEEKAESSITHES